MNTRNDLFVFLMVFLAALLAVAASLFLFSPSHHAPALSAPHVGSVTAVAQYGDYAVGGMNGKMERDEVVYFHVPFPKLDTGIVSVTCIRRNHFEYHNLDRGYCGNGTEQPLQARSVSKAIVVVTVDVPELPKIDDGGETIKCDGGNPGNLTCTGKAGEDPNRQGTMPADNAGGNGNGQHGNQNTGGNGGGNGGNGGNH